MDAIEPKGAIYLSARFNLVGRTTRKATRLDVGGRRSQMAVAKKPAWPSCRSTRLVRRQTKDGAACRSARCRWPTLRVRCRAYVRVSSHLPEREDKSWTCEIRAGSQRLGVFVADGRRGANAKLHPPKNQIAAAVLPLPAEARRRAKVLGYGAAGKLTTLRKGTGMVCLAHDPKSRAVPRLVLSRVDGAVHGSRSRAAHSGTTGTQVDSVRFGEVKSGTLKMPNHPASLYSLTGGNFDPETQTVPGARRLYVVYIPYATGASTGLAEASAGNAAVDHVPGDAEGAHHVHARDVTACSNGVL